MTSGASMLAMIASFPPQRAQASISIPNALPHPLSSAAREVQNVLARRSAGRIAALDHDFAANQNPVPADGTPNLRHPDLAPGLAATPPAGAEAVR